MKEIYHKFYLELRLEGGRGQSYEKKICNTETR